MPTKDKTWSLSWVWIVCGFTIGTVIASVIAAAMVSQTPLGIEDLPSIVFEVILLGMFSGGLAQVACWMLRLLLRCRSRNVEDIVAAVFPAKDREYATEFYESWKDTEYLPVDLGGEDEFVLSRESFFAFAVFYLFSVPGDSGRYGILGADMEDPEGMIAVDKEDGRIVYLYDDMETVLSSDLKSFVTALREAGWDGVR